MNFYVGIVNILSHVSQICAENGTGDTDRFHNCKTKVRARFDRLIHFVLDFLTFVLYLITFVQHTIENMPPNRRTREKKTVRFSSY